MGFIHVLGQKGFTSLDAAWLLRIENSSFDFTQKVKASDPRGPNGVWCSSLYCFLPPSVGDNTGFSPSDAILTPAAFCHRREAEGKEEDRESLLDGIRMGERKTAPISLAAGRTEISSSPTTSWGKGSGRDSVFHVPMRTRDRYGIPRDRTPQIFFTFPERDSFPSPISRGMHASIRPITFHLIFHSSKGNL